MKSKKVKFVIASGLILCSIILYMVIWLTHLRISELGTNILVLAMCLVWGLTYIYISLKFIFKDKNDFIANLFKLSYFTSLFLFTMTLPIINYCDGWQIRQDMGNNLSEYFKFIGIISGTYFIFLTLLYLVNIFITALRYLKKKTTIKNVIFSIIIPLTGLIATIIFFMTINAFGLYNNGKCDLITGPSDTGLSYFLLISIIINLVQYKISANNNGYIK